MSHCRALLKMLCQLKTKAQRSPGHKTEDYPQAMIEHRTKQGLEGGTMPHNRGSNL